MEPVVTKKKTGWKVRHEPTEETRRTVSFMKAAGIRNVDIARCLDIDEKTLVKHYKPELDTSLARANSDIAHSLFQQAKSGNVAAQIFWLKTRGRWRENGGDDDSEGAAVSAVEKMREYARKIDESVGSKGDE